MDVELAAGDQQAVVDLIGGGLRAYTARGRPCSTAMPSRAAPTSGRGQVLIPWPNRLEDGSYEWDGRRHQLPLTEPERGNAIHGLVRGERWSLAAQEDGRAVVEYRLEPQPGYPFSLALAIEYSLSPDGLRVETTAENTGSEAAPFGSGMHPYLTPGRSTTSCCAPRAASCCTPTSAACPAGREPVAGTDYDFTRARRSAPRSSTTPSPTSSAARTDWRASSSATSRCGSTSRTASSSSSPATRCRTSPGAAWRSSR